MKSIHSKIPAYKNSKTLVYNPTLKYFMDKIDNNEYFTFIRWHHGLFDILYPFADKIINCRKADDRFMSELAKSIVTLGVKNNKNWYYNDKKFIEILKENLKILYSTIPSNLYIGIYPVFIDSKGEHKINKFTNEERNTSMEKYFDKIINKFSQNKNFYHSTIWAKWVFEGDFLKFLDKYNNYPIVLIGAPYFKDFGEVMGLKNFYHISIPFKKAYKKIDNIIETTYKQHVDLLKNNKKVIYIGAGSFVTRYIFCKLLSSTGKDPFIYNKNKKYKLNNAFMIDIGRALNLYYYWPVKKNPKKYKNKKNILNDINALDAVRCIPNKHNVIPT
jgi:hypothetical protein